MWVFPFISLYFFKFLVHFAYQCYLILWHVIQIECLQASSVLTLLSANLSIWARISRLNKLVKNSSPSLAPPKMINKTYSFIVFGTWSLYCIPSAYTWRQWFNYNRVIKSNLEPVTPWISGYLVNYSKMRTSYVSRGLWPVPMTSRSCSLI